MQCHTLSLYLILFYAIDLEMLFLRIQTLADCYIEVSCFYRNAKPEFECIV